MFLRKLFFILLGLILINLSADIYKGEMILNSKLKSTQAGDEDSAFIVNFNFQINSNFVEPKTQNIYTDLFIVYGVVKRGKGDFSNGALSADGGRLYPLGSKDLEILQGIKDFDEEESIKGIFPLTTNLIGQCFGLSPKDHREFKEKVIFKITNFSEIDFERIKNGETMKMEFDWFFLNPEIKVDKVKQRNHFIFYEIIEKKNLEELKSLIDEGFKIDSPINEVGKSMIFYSDTDLTKILISYGAKVNQHDEIQETPLRKAIRDKNINKAILLIEAGAKIEGRDWASDTTLELARKTLIDVENKDKFIDYLISKGAK